MRPTRGRIVDYTNKATPPKVMPAIVLRADETTLQLYVFGAVDGHAGALVLEDVEQTQAPAGTELARGRWSWPARDPE